MESLGNGAKDAWSCIVDVFARGDACCMMRLIGYFMHMHRPWIMKQEGNVGVTD